MRILLTNSPFQYFHTTCFFFPDWGALNLAQLAAMVDVPENQIKILDNWHFWFKSNGIIDAIKEFSPDLIGISNSTDLDTESVLEIAGEIKKKYPDIILVGGGQAATVKYDYLLERGFDIIVLGEGEITFQELISALNKKNGDLAKIKGLAYKSGGQIIETEPRPFIENLDQLPFPARHYQKKMKSIFFSGRISSEIETARGCPHKCSYCSISAFWQKTLRKKSNSRIMAELKELKYKFGVTQVYFIDDVFGVNVQEYMELFEMMIAEKLDIKWLTQIRADTVADNPKMMNLAANSGMFCAIVGFEGYNSEILKSVDKIGSKEINEKASSVLRANKILIFGAHMYNLPGQTFSDYRSTYKYGTKNSDIFRLLVFTPIRGTPIFEQLKKEGKIEFKDKNHYALKENKDAVIIRFLWHWYLSLYYLGPRNITVTFFNRDRLLRIMKKQAYICSFRYIFYIFLRKINLKAL